MPRMIYITMVRFPTEKAHGLQIAQNCEAFANAGYEVRLWVSSRRNSQQMQQVSDIHAHYGVDPVFSMERVPGLDLYPLARRNALLERAAFYIHTFTFCLFLLLKVLFNRTNRAEVYYSRDEWVLLALSLLFPPEKLAYEVHQYAPSQRGAALQRRVIQRVGSVIAITPKLRDDLIAERGASPEKILVAHDGIRAKRFAALPTKSAARQQIGWSQDAFIVGFVGRLEMLKMDKGVGLLVQALMQVEGVSFGLVGGPERGAESLREQWQKLDLPEENFLYAGQVAPDVVPTYLAAFDVCAMPHPFTPQFAYYTSPLKLFEYMAAGRAIVASDLPGWSDVVQQEETALLVPAGDADALAAAIQRLRDDEALREKLGTNARQRAMQHYTWAARAAAIKAHIERAILAASES